MPSAQKLHSSVRSLARLGINLQNPPENGSLVNYERRKQFLAMQEFSTALEEVRKASLELPGVARKHPEHADAVNEILELIPLLAETDLVKLEKTTARIEKLWKFPQEKEFKVHVPRLPAEISSEVRADLDELQKCFDNGCYRSCVILCGRVLEVALHRKYFDATGFDILEKNPGIGLGNLVAKLAEKEVKLDPGLKQQIHLINQVRIFSVHKKKDSFYPSSEQAQAIILYTGDILKKLF